VVMKQAGVGSNIVSVGQVDISVLNRYAKGGQGKECQAPNGVRNMVEDARLSREVEVHVDDRQQSTVRNLVRIYRPNENDVQWARSGVFVNVVNGEAITVVQNQVVDAGFADLDVIPMEADRVFLRSNSERETVAMIEGAKYFFDLLFSNIVRWDKEVLPFQRGAWMRLYGILIHAWNENFFQIMCDGQWVLSTIG